MKRCLSILVTLLLVTGTWQTAFADSARVQYPSNGHYYQRFDAERSWSSARTYCEDSGGYLATLTSQGENDFVFQSMGIAGPNIWLGGTDENSEGNWEWVTGEAWSYTNWGAGQPDNQAPGQDYLIFWGVSPGMWDDNGLPRNDFSAAKFICEWTQLPEVGKQSTAVPTIGQWGMIIMSLLLAGSAIWILRKRHTT